MTDRHKPRNIDPETVAGFGEEWAAFDQETLPHEDLTDQFDDYFHIFPFQRLAPEASGRWSRIRAISRARSRVEP